MGSFCLTKLYFRLILWMPNIIVERFTKRTAKHRVRSVIECNIIDKNLLFLVFIEQSETGKIH